MAIDFAGIGGSLIGWFVTIFFYVLFALVVSMFGFGFLWLKKQRKFSIPVIEITSLGEGKVGMKNLKAGWFKTETMFFGLIEKGGEDRLIVKDGRVIANASSEDFHTINGNMGLVIQRKGDDPKILLPIHKSTLFTKVRMVIDEKTGKPKLDEMGKPIRKIELDGESVKIMNSIASGDYRDVSTNIIRRAEHETMNKFARFLQEYTPLIQAGILVISIIFVIQYAKHSQTEAWLNTQEAIKMAYKNKGAILPSAAPLLMFIPRKIMRWFK